jgi:membrane-associated protein
MFQQALDVATHSDWAYLIVFAVAAIDAVFPAVPGETTLITAAALAASGRLSIAAVFVAGALGAAVGDNTAYLIGRVSSRGVQRLTHRSRLHAAMQWAERELRARGATLVIVSRFIPGGRTATMLAAGVTRMPWRRFVLFDLAAAVIWSAYGTVLGVVGGVAFTDRPLLAVVVALSLAGVLTIAIEGVRRLRARRSGGTPDAAPPPDA